MMNSGFIHRYLLAVILLFFLAAAFLWSAEAIMLTEKKGSWLPWKVGFVDNPEIPQEGTITLKQIDIDTTLAKLENISQVFQQVGVLDPPVGFELSRRGSIKRNHGGSIQSDLLMILFAYFKDCNDCPGQVSEEGPGIYVYANALDRIYTQHEFLDKDSVGDMYLVPKVIGNVAGFPEYENGYVVLTKVERPMWAPVSQERWIKNEIRKGREVLIEIEATIAEGSPLKQWISDRERRQAEMEKVYEQLKSINPQAAEELRTRQKKMEEEMKRQLTENEGENVAGQIKMLDDVKGRMAALEAELASLSAEQLAGPAFYPGDSRSDIRPSLLVDPDAPSAREIVCTNPDFFDPKLPKTALQLLAIRIKHRNPDSFLGKKISQIRQTLNWNLLYEALD
jgi:hypothetical protein